MYLRSEFSRMPFLHRECIFLQEGRVKYEIVTLCRIRIFKYAVQV